MRLAAKWDALERICVLDAVSDGGLATPSAHHLVRSFFVSAVHLGFVLQQTQQQDCGSLLIAVNSPIRSSLNAVTCPDISTLVSARVASNREIAASSLSKLLLVKKKMTT